MAQYIENRNNGVIAVIAVDDLPNWQLATDSGGDPLKIGVRVFTFCDQERFQDPSERMVFTGDYKFLGELIKHGKHDLISLRDCYGNCSWGGFVPFSNQEHVMNPDGEWRKWVTTAADVIQKFGLRGGA